MAKYIYESESWPHFTWTERYDDPNAGNNLGYDFDWLYHIITYNHPN